MLGSQKKNVMQKQGLLPPLWALNDPRPCLEGKAKHKVIHSFPLPKQPEPALQHVVLTGFAVPEVGT